MIHSDCLGFASVPRCHGVTCVGDVRCGHDLPQSCSAREVTFVHEESLARKESLIKKDRMTSKRSFSKEKSDTCEDSLAYIWKSLVPEESLDRKESLIK